MTAKVNVVELLPPAFVAVIVYVAEALIPVGVPEIAPVDVSSVRPTGSSGETDQDTTVPPLEVGVIATIGTFLVSVRLLTLYDTAVGGASLTRIEIVVVALPPVLVAVTVYCVDEETAVGVPLIAPVEVSKDNPAGTDGEIDQLVTAPPLVVGTAGIIAESFVNVNGFPL